MISAVSSAISSSLQARPALRPLFSLRRLIKRYWRLVFRERSTLLYKLKVKRPLIFANLRPMLEKKLNIRFEVFRFKNIFSITFLTKQDLITFARNKGVLGVSRSSNKLLRRIFKAYVDVRYRKFRYLRFFADIIPIFYLSIILHNLAPLGQILQKGLMANQRSHHKFFKFISALVRIEKSYLSLFCVGFSLQFVGRIQGKRRSTLKSSKFGTLPLQSLSRRVFYYYIPCTVKYGSIGIRL